MIDQKRMPPELLSPAGDWESLRAAVANGANAVYFGLSAFNARARAHNFTVEELPEVMAFLHRRNTRGFVALNTLIFSDELEEVTEFVKAIAAAGVDAVIVQDLGLVTLIRRLAPTLPIHGSTQMTLTEPRGIEFVKRLGVERVVLARELSLEEIREVTAGTTMPVEVFIHGALCVAYSGQCLTSEALGGRSANRGQCAQACRLPYEMIVDGVKRELGDKAYLLSPQDLAAYELIQPLIEAGVISFKIEGRLKGGPYVASTTKTYRTAIDAALEKQDFKLTRREELDLAQTFSRGLTPGFLEGVNHQKLVRGRFPKSRGIRVGKAIWIQRNAVRVELCEDVPGLLNAGDGVMFDMGTPAEKEPGGRIWKVLQGPNNRVELHFEPSVDLSMVPVGCEVWKTDDPALRKRLEQTYVQDKPARREPLKATISGIVGGEIILTLATVNGIAASATWPGPLELATKRTTTTEELHDNLNRLGETPYELGHFVNELPAGVLVPKSVLNDLRRRAVAELEAKQLAASRHVIAEPDALLAGRASDGSSFAPSLARPTNLTVLCRSLEQLEAVLAWKPGVAAVYCDFEDLRKYKDAVPKAKSAGIPIGLATLRVWKPGEDGLASIIARANPDAVLVRNLASLEYFREHLPGVQLLGDFSLNASNELTAGLLFREGLDRLVPSYDMNWGQFESMMKRSVPGRFEAVIHQHMPMFHNEFCVFASALSNGKDFRDCGRPCDRHKIELRDRMGALFPVLADTGCRNTVYNSVPQSAAEYVGRMKEVGLRWFRVDLLRETPEEVCRLLDHYAAVINGTDDGRQTWKKVKAMNQLGVTRGTLQMV
jgi:putative protease